jgi:hypothetical protein
MRKDVDTHFFAVRQAPLLGPETNPPRATTFHIRLPLNSLGFPAGAPLN